jgi:hypothetical protein
MENSLKYSTLLYERKTRIPVGEIKKCFRNIQVYTISECSSPDLKGQVS